MPPLLSIAAAFVAGLLAGPWIPFLAGIATAVCAALLTWLRPRPQLLLLTVFGLGVISTSPPEAVGFDHGPTTEQAGSCRVTGTLQRTRRRGTKTWDMEMTDAVIDCGQGPFHSEKVILWGNQTLSAGFLPGRRVTAACRRSPYLHDHRPTRMHCHDLVPWAGRPDSKLAILETIIRAKADRLLTEASLSGDDLLWAMLLGSRLRHKPRTKRLFARLGIAHLLVVSGLHLSMLALLVVGMWRLVFLAAPGLMQRWPARKASALLGLPVIWGYVMLVGGSAATTRAAIMATCLLMGLAADRPASTANSLVAAAIVLLVWHPDWLVKPGFQLSFAATAALVWFGHMWKSSTKDQAESPHSRVISGPTWLFDKMKRGLLASLLASLAAWAATVPLTAHWFGGLSVIGPLVNLVAVPYFCWVVLPLGMAGLAFGLLWPKAGIVLLIASDEAAHLARIVLGGLANHTQWAWLPVSPKWWQALAGLVFLAAAAKLILAATTGPRLWSRRTIAAVSVAMVGWALAVGMDLQPAPRNLVVAFLGQKAGNAILVTTPGKAVLIDTGGGHRGGRAVLAQLRRRRIQCLDLVVATHPHADHVSGLTHVLEAHCVRRLWVAGRSAGPTWRALLAVARHRYILVERPRHMNMGGLHIDPLLPAGRRNDDMDPSLSRNDNSVALRLSFHKRALLVVGDLERRGQHLLIVSGRNVRADLLAAPHHGSAQSFSEAFLKAVAPQVVVISGHTTQTEPDLYGRQGAQVWTTDREGPVEVSLDPDSDSPRIHGLKRP